jgi:methanogenic corrinoid protein MtbC1
VTAALHRRISTVYEAAGVSTVPPRVVVGLPAGCRHELGALMFATLVRRQHVATRYLGEDLPAEEWVGAVSALGPTAAVVVVPTSSDVAPARETVARLRQEHPALMVLTGGRHQDDVADATPLGHDIVEAAASLAQQVHTATSPA